jgi:signal transduction histidine kinase
MEHLEAMDQMRADLVATQGRVEQLLAERTRALADRQRLLGSLLEAVPDVVIVVSADRHVAEANQTARALLGADIEGRTCHDVLHGRADACSGCPLDRVLAGQPAGEPELPQSTAGREAVVYSLVPIGAPGAPAERALYTGRIVTRERTLQTRLAHQEKIAAVGALAAGVAHEVRNPLASLSSLVQLRLRATDDAQLRADLAFILDHVERIDRTVKNLTLAAREPASGRRPALLGDLIERAVQLAHFDPRAHGVGLEVRLDPDTPALDLDEDAWLHVLLNLLVNSLDAVEDSAERRVTITLAGGPGGVELEVADTGAGMSPQVLARATEPMFTTKPPGRGTGLGLHLVREVVEQHGGTLELDSQPGRGTVVKIRLPAPERVAAVARAAADGGSK